MFTVLIAEKHYIDAIRLENKLFFEPFLENKELAFCCWNPQGQDLNDSVPELVDIVGRKKEWKAVIIGNCNADTVKQKNPFDVADYSTLENIIIPPSNPDVEGSCDEWIESWSKYFENLTQKKEKIFKNSINQPLQKLATWLSFKPTDFVMKDVGEKSDIHEWALNELGQGVLNYGARLEKLEREQYRIELKLKETIRRDFIGDSSINIAAPKEIYCISKRVSDNGFFDPDNFWNTRSQNEYSEFCDRNMYFDKMRFMVFDLLPETHKNYRCDEIRFLSTLLIFASNSVPGSTMEARKLYVLECEDDDTPLYTLVTSYDKKLASTYEVIENEIDRIYGEIPGKLTDKMAESLFCSPINVEVKLDDSCDLDALYAEDEFTLLPLSAEAEEAEWKQSFDKSKNSYGFIIRQQKRSVKKGVDRLNISSDLSASDISRLTPFQLDDIRDYTENAENEMVASLPPDLADHSKYEKIMQEKSDSVKKVLKRRMNRVTALIVGLSILVLTFILCVPFVATNLSDARASSQSLIVILGMVSVLAVALIVTLIFLKKPLTNAVNDYNDAMKDVVYDINSNMRRFSRYFGLSCAVRRGSKIRNFAEKNLDEYTKSIRIRKKHQEDIRKRRAELAEMYHDFIGDSKYYENSMIQPYDFDFEKQVEYVYTAPFMAGFGKTIDFLEVGNPVEVPSGYITRITVRMEEIYDK